MPRGRLPLTPDQRSANKIEGDRRRRREHKIEFQRLQILVVGLSDENTSLKDEIEMFKDMVLNLQNTVQQQQQLIQQLQHQDEEANKMVDSFLNFHEYPSPIEEVANYESIAGGGASSSQNERVFEGSISREEAERQRKEKAPQNFRN